MFSLDNHVILLLHLRCTKLEIIGSTSLLTKSALICSGEGFVSIRKGFYLHFTLKDYHYVVNCILFKKLFTYPNFCYVKMWVFCVIKFLFENLGSLRGSFSQKLWLYNEIMQNYTIPFKIRKFATNGYKYLSLLIGISSLMRYLQSISWFVTCPKTRSFLWSGKIIGWGDDAIRNVL